MHIIILDTITDTLQYIHNVTLEGKGTHDCPDT